LWLQDLRIISLAFLAQEPMTSQLAELNLTRCKRLPLTELRHVHGLRRLEALYLEDAFNEHMDTLSEALHTPPSLLMPQLQEFSIQWSDFAQHQWRDAGSRVPTAGHSC
jgi:hypothetical protein